MRVAPIQASGRRAGESGWFFKSFKDRVLRPSDRLRASPGLHGCDASRLTSAAKAAFHFLQLSGPDLKSCPSQNHLANNVWSQRRSAGHPRPGSETWGEWGGTV